MQSSKKRTLSNICIAAGITALIMLLIAALFDYYFDLNDDVSMKNILSGNYTGMPEGHNIQMLYPVSAFISLIYRLFKDNDVYGIFLCACQYLCIFVVINRMLQVCKSSKAKVASLMVSIAFFAGCILGHLIYVQYTFTVAMLSFTAAFLVITGEGRRNRILVCLLIWLSYLIRSEMLLLMLPMAGFAWFYRLVEDNRKGIKLIYIRWALVLFAGILVCTGIDKFAYSNPGWSEFVKLFDARTQLYDYQTIPSYEQNKDFYDSIGLDESEVELLFNYNYGLDDEIDFAAMEQVAEYARSIKDETLMLYRIKQALYSYVYRLHHFGFQKEYQYPQTDAPMNIIILVLYLGLLICALILIATGNKKEGIRRLLYLILLFIIRSLLWMYILIGERDPIRITHGLMIMEIGVLSGMLFHSMQLQKKNRIFICLTAIVLITSFCYLPNTIHVASEEASNREAFNEKFNELYSYIKADADNFYWIDLYTSVSYTSKEYTSYSYSEKMFGDTDNSFDNYDILGGWFCKSPLQQKKLDRYGFSDIQSSLLEDNVYFVITDESSTDWLTKYYNNKGIDVTLNEVCIVADKFRIIKLSEN